MSAVSCRVVFLDRDGTINVDTGYLYRIADWRFTNGAIEAITLLRTTGFHIAVVTNQSGIASGAYLTSDVECLHDYMQREVTKGGTSIDAIALCPHASDANCDCRKPRIGMVAQIEQRLGKAIEYPASWTIGDKPTDIEFGATLGTNTALIRSRYWCEDNDDVRPTIVVSSLYEAACYIASRERPPPSSTV